MTHKTAFTAVVFDLGGVLIDWDPRNLYRKLFDDPEAMERFLAEVCTQPWNEEQDAGRSFAEGVAELTALYPDQAHLIEAYDRRWEEMILGPIEDAVAVFLEVVDTDIPLFALTNWSSEKFPIARRRFAHFLDHFRDILVSGEVGLKKPDPRIYRAMLARFELAADEIIFIDDSEKNVEAARAEGIESYRFVGAEQLRQRLVECGVLAR